MIILATLTSIYMHGSSSNRLSNSSQKRIVIKKAIPHLRDGLQVCLVTIY